MLEHFKFSSPFIEERLYLIEQVEEVEKGESSRPLLSRSGCIFYKMKINDLWYKTSSRPLLSRSGCI